jgi:hypothetical protein
MNVRFLPSALHHLKARDVSESPLIEEANQALNKFHSVVKGEYDQASELYQFTRVIGGSEMSDQDQIQAGTRIIKRAREIHSRVDIAYRKVVLVQEKLSQAVLSHDGTAPVCTKAMCDAYEHTLRYSFRDVHHEYQSICGYLDGLMDAVPHHMRRASRRKGFYTHVKIQL